MKIDQERPRSAHRIPPLRLDLGTDCARTRWRHHAPPRLTHAQGPCACVYVLGFFRRPPCRPQSVPRDLSNNARARPFFTGTGSPLRTGDSDLAISVLAFSRSRSDARRGRRRARNQEIRVRANRTAKTGRETAQCAALRCTVARWYPELRTGR